MMQGIEAFLGTPDCARSVIFAAYLAFMWGVVGLANYLDRPNID
jgi:hypothetical protein